MPMQRNDVADAFKAHYGAGPTWIVRAPGRVNLIGEHTDYNDGFVLPMAIDRAVWIALRPRPDRRVAAHSADFGATGDFSLDDLPLAASHPRRSPAWIEYLKGVGWAMKASGQALCGWDGLVRGDVPQGAGLSSSAALEMAAARAFVAAGGLAWEPAAMARIGQQAENQWIGVRCGIMDQLVSAAGRADHALLIDCRTLHVEPVPLPPGIAVVVLDTATRRGLADVAYNERREQCEAAASYFGVKALRDVDEAEFQRGAAGLDETARRRARHVITENRRTLAAALAMRNGDAGELGRLMRESHASLRDDFEVSSPALDAMVAAALAQRVCYGARMTGAGFGGCAVAIVEVAAVEDFAAAAGADYRRQTGLAPSIYVCGAADGADVVP